MSQQSNSQWAPKDRSVAYVSNTDSETQATLIADLQKRLIELERKSKQNVDALNDAVDGVIQVNSHFSISFYNKAAIKMFGYLQEEVIGKHLKIIFTKVNSDITDKTADNYIVKIFSKTVGSSCEMEATSKDGTKFWINLSISKTESDDELLYTAFIKDISPQKKNVLELNEVHRELKTRMDQINVACIVSESDLQGRITYVNDRLCEVSQYKRKECIGQGHNIFRHPDMPGSFFKEMWSILEKGKIFRGIIKNRKKDGSTYWVDAVIAPVLGDNGKPIKYIAVRYVITDLVLNEEQLKVAYEKQSDALNAIARISNENQTKKDQLEKLNFQMEKFLYSTSHDLRSPIATILGLVNLLRMETKDRMVLEYVSKIEISANKLDKTIKDIMIFSRTAYQRITSERIDFETIVWKVWHSFGNEEAFRKINFTLELTGDNQFYSDLQRMKIIFDKILANAMHFYDPNKATPFITIKIRLSAELAQIEFIDNGIGIGKASLDHIFTMFYKASHISSGAGLGLFIVKETTEQLKGKIKVESEIGFGSVFRISIPNDPKGKLINRKIQLENAKK